ncbi:MAG: hypothetical protein JO154_12750 [Chitinophaga sp.]|uniref:hypothetical protein n=1 Tax=Chitinophaga sp. TaxID=1869181 RepID=UPI0025BECA3F|nr:hypothetical protein [Chitinophaga sp.]MBV8253469.1 hypothetical protein [Chitinophaga sp.]
MTPNRIIEHIFHVPDLHQVDEAALKKLVTEYPYFATARVLMAKKDYSRHEDLNSPTVKTGSIYSHQAHHFYQFVTTEAVLMPVEERIARVIPTDTLPEAIHTPPAPANTEADIPAVPTAFTEAIIHEPSVLNTQSTTIQHDEAEVSQDLDILNPTVQLSAAEVVDQAVEEEVKHDLDILNPTVQLPAAEVVDQAVEEEVTEDMAILDPSVHLAAAEEPVATEPSPVAEDEPEVSSAAPPQADINNFETTAVPEAEEASSEPIKIFPLEIPTEEATELVFQPLFTDDYFAYKRLKDPEHADELSVQREAEMKSFTSWLRQMKDNFAGRTSKDWYQQQLHRLYEETEEPEISETVEKMALDSIKVDTDIVSETLAEIWVRQHQYQNAIQIYQKLSLLNPNKNAYFAQKIKDLKSLIDKNK